MSKSFYYGQVVMCENLTEDTIYNDEIGIIFDEEMHHGRYHVDIISIDTRSDVEDHSSEVKGSDDTYIPIKIKPKNIVHVCEYCWTPQPPKKCSQCRVARYCNESCQKSSWKFHKTNCDDVKMLRLDKLSRSKDGVN